jgi:vanillate O-demethylase ferredoxin subunit
MQDRTLTVRVARIEVMTPEVKAFELVHPWGGRLPHYRAGAHVDVHTPGGFKRPYSLACAAGSAAAPPRYVIGVKREPASRGASAALHEQVQVGDLLAISTPRNSFALQPGAGPHWLLAGGIGLTPLLSMAEQAVSEGLDVHLCVFARSRRHLAFADALAALGPRVRYHFDDPAAPEKIDLAAFLGSPSFAHAAATAAAHGALPLAEQRAAAQLYLCGPAGFMRAVRQAAAHWPEEQIHAEYFAAPEGSADASCGDPFELCLALSGSRLQVGADQSAVQALAAIGIDVPTSCEQGLCGTCVVPWRDSDGGGEPVHRDFCLTGVERRHKVALCCSRARSGVLVVDL